MNNATEIKDRPGVVITVIDNPHQMVNVEIEGINPLQLDLDGADLDKLVSPVNIETLSRCLMGRLVCLAEDDNPVELGVLSEIVDPITNTVVNHVFYKTLDRYTEEDGVSQFELHDWKTTLPLTVDTSRISLDDLGEAIISAGEHGLYGHGEAAFRLKSLIFTGSREFRYELVKPIEA